MLQRSGFISFVLIGWLGQLSGECFAIDRTWIGGSDFWKIDSNWNPTGQPQPADNAFVNGSPEVTDVEIFNELDNSGEFRSSSGATINLSFAQYSQGASGQLIADTDNITLTGGTSITGGSLETVGGGFFDTNGLITLSDVTVNAPIDNSNTSGPINDARLFVSGGGITNNSTITVAGTSGRKSQFGFTDPGSLDGSFVMGHPQARLEIELGGLTAGTEHDQLVSAGMVTLAGVLNVLDVDLGDYIPAAGDRFEIINSITPISGTFNTVNFPCIGFGRKLTWQPVDYTTDPNKVFLEIASVGFFDADFDEDGDVDGDDLTRWQANYETGTSHMQDDAIATVM